MHSLFLCFFFVCVRAATQISAFNTYILILRLLLTAAAEVESMSTLVSETASAGVTQGVNRLCSLCFFVSVLYVAPY